MVHAVPAITVTLWACVFGLYINVIIIFIPKVKNAINRIIIMAQKTGFLLMISQQCMLYTLLANITDPLESSQHTQ